MVNTDTIAITPELLTLVSEIDEFKGAWRALAPPGAGPIKGATIERIGSLTPIEGGGRSTWYSLP